MKRLTHRDIHCVATERVSMTEYESNPDRVECYTRDYLRKIIADLIVRKKVTESNDDFFKEYRLDLYIATPSEFWEIVEREATEIAGRFK